MMNQKDKLSRGDGEKDTTDDDSVLLCENFDGCKNEARGGGVLFRMSLQYFEEA